MPGSASTRAASIVGGSDTNGTGPGAMPGRGRVRGRRMIPGTGRVSVVEPEGSEALA